MHRRAKGRRICCQDAKLFDCHLNGGVWNRTMEWHVAILCMHFRGFKINIKWVEKFDIKA